MSQVSIRRTEPRGRWGRVGGRQMVGGWDGYLMGSCDKPGGNRGHPLVPPRSLPPRPVFSALMEGDHPSGTSLITAVVIPVPDTHTESQT